DGLAIDVHAGDAATQWDDPADNRIPESVRLAVYRVLEEVLGNVRKHSRARTATVRLDVEPPDCLVVTVVDDGKGFDPKRVRAGLGMSAVAARVEALGGTWHIESAPA